LRYPYYRLLQKNCYCMIKISISTFFLWVSFQQNKRTLSKWTETAYWHLVWKGEGKSAHIKPHLLNLMFYTCYLFYDSMILCGPLFPWSRSTMTYSMRSRCSSMGPNTAHKVNSLTQIFILWHGPQIIQQSSAHRRPADELYR
jgi:hypothetical protein